MDATTLARLVAAHARFPAVLRALLEPLDPELLRAREREGRWSPLEILVHLRDEEVEDFRPRAQAAAEGRNDFAPIEPERWVTERAYEREDPGAILADLERERARSCAWLRDLDAARLARGFDHPRAGHLRAADLVAAWRMHDLLHLRQLTTALTRLEAQRLADYRIDYAGTLPQG